MTPATAQPELHRASSSTLAKVALPCTMGLRGSDMKQRSLIFGACLALAFGWASCDGDDDTFTTSSSGSGGSSASGTGGEGGSGTGGEGGSGTGGEGGSGTGGEGGSSSSGTGGEGGGGILVNCGGLSCVPPDVCCVTGGGQTACTAANSCTGVTLSCDNQGDCSPEICCHTTNPPAFSCQPTCGGSAGGMIICDGPADTSCPTAEPSCCSVMGGIVFVCQQSC